MGAFTPPEERDECDLNREREAVKDARLAEAYANGRRAGSRPEVVRPCPEETEEAKEWLAGYLTGLADFIRGQK
jgi:hypothetical protein